MCPWRTESDFAWGAGGKGDRKLGSSKILGWGKATKWSLTDAFLQSHMLLEAPKAEFKLEYVSTTPDM